MFFVCLCCSTRRYADPTPCVQVAKTVNPHISQFAQVMLESCGYAGTGDVLKIQQLLALCGQHLAQDEEPKPWQVGTMEFVSLCALLRCAVENASEGAHPCAIFVPCLPQTAHQGAAVLGLALVAMAEDLGQQMSCRTLEHLLQYGDLAVRYVGS